MARKKGGAWGNALGGFRTQKRNAFGQFGTGTPVRRGNKASFQSGGTPRYYAPGGKTYATKNNGFVKSQGSSTAKQARRNAGIEAAIAKRETQAKKKSRNRKIVAGVAIGALAIGGAVAYQKSGRSAPADLQQLRSNIPNLKKNRIAKSARASEIPNLSRSTSHGPDAMINRVKDMQAHGPHHDQLRAYEREVAEAYGVTGPSPSKAKDDGHTPATAVLKATAAGGVALTAAKQAADVVAHVSKAAQEVKQLDEDGVSRNGRYVPEAAIMPPAYSKFQDLSSVVDGNADNRYSIASHKSLAPGETNDSWEKELAKNGVVMREYGTTSDQYGETVVQSKRAPMKPGEAVGSGDASVMDRRYSPNMSAQDRRVLDSEIDQITGAGSAPGKKIRSTGTPVKLEAADRSAGRAMAGNKTPRKWTENESADWDREIVAQRQKAAARKAYQEAGGVVESRAAFPKGKGDHDTYNIRGQVNGRTNAAEDQWNSRVRDLEKTNGPNVINGDRMSKAQEEDLAAHLGVKANPRDLVGQKVRGAHDKGYQALSPGAQEDFAEKFLDEYEKFVAGGGKPDRYSRQRAAFFRGEIPSHPIDARGELSKAENARINARARARNRKAKKNG